MYENKSKFVFSVEIQEVPFGEWQETQVESHAELLVTLAHSILILGERFALSRGKTPLDCARERGKTEMEQFLLNWPARAPRPWFLSCSELVLAESRGQLHNWKILAKDYAKELRFFENVQQHWRWEGIVELARLPDRIHLLCWMRSNADPLWGWQGIKGSQEGGTIWFERRWKKQMKGHSEN